MFLELNSFICSVEGNSSVKDRPIIVIFDSSDALHLLSLTYFGIPSQAKGSAFVVLCDSLVVFPSQNPASSLDWSCMPDMIRCTMWTHDSR